MKSRDSMEMEANVFATLLLIPEHLLLPELEKGIDLGGKRKKGEEEDIDLLCKKFGVTKPTMTFRLQLLNKKYPKGYGKTVSNPRSSEG